MTNNLKIEDIVEVEKAGLLEGLEIVELLPKNTSKEKIEELAMNWIIPQSDLDVLVAQGLLSEEQKKEIVDKLQQEVLNKLYDKLFTQEREIGLEEQEKSTKKGSNQSQRKNDTSNVAQEPSEGNLRDERAHRFFESLGNIFDNLGKVTLAGTKRNSLNGYKIYSSKELGVVVFVKRNESGNATYIMSLPEAAYIFQKANLAEKIMTIDATKKQIRKRAKGDVSETEEVEKTILTQSRGKGTQVLIQSANWELNLLDKILQVAKDGEGKKEIERILKEYKQRKKSSTKGKKRKNQTKHKKGDADDKAKADKATPKAEGDKSKAEKDDTDDKTKADDSDTPKDNGDEISVDDTDSDAR